MKKTLILAALAALFFLGMSTTAVAADVSGTWKFDAPQGGGGGGMGSFERTLVLKQDGNTLTGKYTMVFGDNTTEANIENGKVNGNEITFTVKMPGFGGGPDRVTNFRAKVNGDKMEGVQESPQPFTASKSK